MFCSADKARCNELHKPKVEKACKNDVPCGGKWFTGPWSKVSSTNKIMILSRQWTTINSESLSVGKTL